MTTEVKIAPPNSIVFVMDPDSGEIPETGNRNLVN